LETWSLRDFLFPPAGLALVLDWINGFFELRSNHQSIPKRARTRES